MEQKECVMQSRFTNEHVLGPFYSNFLHFFCFVKTNFQNVFYILETSLGVLKQSEKRKRK